MKLASANSLLLAVFMKDEVVPAGADPYLGGACCGGERRLGLRQSISVGPHHLLTDEPKASGRNDDGPLNIQLNLKPKIEESNRSGGRAPLIRKGEALQTQRIWLTTG